jgi:DNA-binding NarL/FixJ family response regulator
MMSAATGSETPRRYRVLLVDEHPIVREGLTRLINEEPDLVVCAEADGSGSVLDALAHLQPDILVLDMSPNRPDGIDVLKTIRSTDENLPILVVSMHDESIYAERVLHAGANGYIMKQDATGNVLVALRRLLRHEVYVSQRIANRMRRQFAARFTKVTPGPVASLSEEVN